MSLIQAPKLSVISNVRNLWHLAIPKNVPLHQIDCVFPIISSHTAS